MLVPVQRRPRAQMDVTLRTKAPSRAASSRSERWERRRVFPRARSRARPPPSVASSSLQGARLHQSWSWLPFVDECLELTRVDANRRSRAVAELEPGKGTVTDLPPHGAFGEAKLTTDFVDGEEAISLRQRLSLHDT